MSSSRTEKGRELRVIGKASTTKFHVRISAIPCALFPGFIQNLLPVGCNLFKVSDANIFTRKRVRDHLGAHTMQTSSLVNRERNQMN